MAPDLGPFLCFYNLLLIFPIFDFFVIFYINIGVFHQISLTFLISDDIIIMQVKEITKYYRYEHHRRDFGTEGTRKLPPIVFEILR